MNLEHRSAPLLSRPAFFRRLLNFAFLAAFIIIGSLGLGILGYHFCAGLGWRDSLVNASMILTGMGPVNPIKSVSGKFFESAYALFSGIVFLTSAALLITPVFHRFLHHFHLEMEEGKRR